MEEERTTIDLTPTDPAPDENAPPVPDPSVPGHYDFVITPASGELGADGQ